MPPMLFLLLLLTGSVHGTLYILSDDEYNVIVTSFDDIVNLFGPNIFHVDGFLVVTSPETACTAIQPPPTQFPSVIDGRLKNATTDSDSNFVALVRNGKCDSDLKVLNAQRAGYSAVIIYNNHNQSLLPLAGHDWVNQIEIPSVVVDKSTGQRLKSYVWTNEQAKFLVSMVSFYSLPLKYVLLCLLLLVGISLLVLISCLTAHLCNLWCRAQRGRLSRRHLRQLLIKRFTKGQDPYDTCPICLEDYEERQKLRLLPCQHAFHQDCIDPWLLRNHRRCPVCNRIVDISSSSTANDPSIPHVSFRQRFHDSFNRFRLLRPLSVRIFGATANSMGTMNAVVEDDTAPLLQSDCTEGSPVSMSGDTEGQMHTQADSVAGTSSLTIKLIPEGSPSSACKCSDYNWNSGDVQSSPKIQAEPDDELLSVSDTHHQTP